MKHTVYILLGSNLGERSKNLSQALENIAEVEEILIVKSSSVYNSPAMEMSEPAPDFLNQAIEIKTALSPMELLGELKRIEKQMGRTEKGNYKSRTIDLDILLFDEIVMQTDELVIPQERMLNRPFALIPLAEISPDLIHPIAKKPIAGYISKADHELVTPVEEHAAYSR